MTYHCLICDCPIHLPEHAAVHGWDLDRVRQVGFDCEGILATHEFAYPGGASLFWMAREVRPLAEEVDW